MATVSDLIRSHLLESVGIVDRRPVPSLDDLARCQWDERFDLLRRNRMILGAFRYGWIRPGNLLSYGSQERPYENVDSLVKRARAYQETGNLEHLLDVANLAMIEWMTSRHPQRHFRPEDDGVHTEERKE